MTVTRETLATLSFLIVLAGIAGFLFAPIGNHGWHSPVAGMFDTDLDGTRLGTNLRAVHDWSSQRPFVDLFKQSRPWFTQCDPEEEADCHDGWDTGEAGRLDLDAHGWVRSLPVPSVPGYSIAATVIHQSERLFAGRYILLYDGRGELRYGLGARKLEFASAPGRDVLEVDPEAGAVLIQIHSTDPDKTGDYLRNLRLVRADREALLLSGQWFNPDFLERSRPFQVLRVMEWMRTNGSPVSHWHQRSLPADARYTTAAGVPIEISLQLANTLQASLWVTVPHRADDEFVVRFAELTRDTLAPDLHVFVEYSNEVWNSAFSQRQWIAEQASALWPGEAHSEFTKVVNWYGKRSAEVCGLWKQAFGLGAERVHCVMGGQAANPWVLRQALECPLWADGKPCARRGIDAIAIAPYFGGYVGDSENVAQLEAWSRREEEGSEMLITELEQGGLLPSAPQGGALTQAFGWVDAHARLAEKFGLPLLAYEGGQHLVGVGSVVDNQAVTDLFVRVNRSEAMGRLYSRYLDQWSSRGGKLLMHFSDISKPGPHGSWGALEDVRQTSSPKYMALSRYRSLQSPMF